MTLYQEDDNKKKELPANPFSPIPGSEKTIVPFHRHTGAGGDAPRINFSSIFQKKTWIFVTIPNTTAATATNWPTIFWIAPFRGYVNQIQEVHTSKGTDAGAVTVNVEVLTGTTAPGGGTAILSTAIDLKGNINTVVTGTLAARSSLNFSATDRLALVQSGVLTAVSNVCLTIEVVSN